MLFTHIASKNLHSTNTKAQSKKRLIHRRNNYIKKTNLLNLFPVGDQIKLQSIHAALQKDTVDRQHHDQCQKSQHHRLTDLFYSGLQTKGTDQKSHNNDYDHPEGHALRICKHMRKLIRDTFRIQPLKVIDQETIKVTDHPA